MPRKKKKNRMQGDVELNLAAMLDMSFQLLAFFILTFKPAPVEGQVDLRLPPAAAITASAGKEAGSKDSPDPLKGLNSMPILVYSKTDGSLDQVMLFGTAYKDIKKIETRINQELTKPGSPIDQVVIQVGSRLHYDQLMRIVDICTRAKLANGERLSKMSFLELPEA